MNNFIPLRKRLDNAVKKTRVRLDVLQQDYLLSWVLAGIYQHPLLKESLAFKGGTALKKCYFGDYRFSEDIDFTSTPSAPCESKLMIALTEACEFAKKEMNEYAPLKLEIKRYQEKNPHPHGQEAFAIYGQFPWQSQPLTKVMIEVSKDENLLLKPQFKPLLHGYGETIEQKIMVYALEEIILEKLRAILQHTKKLQERDPYRSRARDYYDLWRILGTFDNHLNLKLVRSLLPLKCHKKEVLFTGIGDFFDEKMISNVRKTWDQYLGPLVSDLPECELVLDDLRSKMTNMVYFTNPRLALGELICNSGLENKDLHQACERVMQAGADVNQAREGLTPFQIAIVKGDKVLADLIHSYGGKKIRPPGLGYVNFYNFYKE